MSKVSTRLGIMGGTFDPIHYGHLRMAEEAREAFGLTEVVFVPSGHPYHKNAREVSSPLDRFHMASLAVCDNPHFSSSPIEIERAGPTYTIDTIRHFHKMNPELEADNLFFITGADAVLQLPTWHEHDALARECRIIAVTRPGFRLERIAESLDPSLADKIAFLAIPGLDISSTEIRRRVKEGKGIRYLTPSTVEAYIAEKQLYR